MQLAHHSCLRPPIMWVPISLGLIKHFTVAYLIIGDPTFWICVLTVIYGIDHVCFLDTEEKFNNSSYIHRRNCGHEGIYGHWFAWSQEALFYAWSWVILLGVILDTWVCIHCEGPGMEAEKLATLKRGAISDEEVFMRSAKENFTEYYQPLIFMRQQTSKGGVFWWKDQVEGGTRIVWSDERDPVERTKRTERCWEQLVLLHRGHHWRGRHSYQGDAQLCHYGNSYRKINITISSQSSHSLSQYICVELYVYMKWVSSHSP